MKKTSLILLIMLSTLLHAHAQEKAMVVRKTSGRSFAIKTTDIDSMVFANSATLSAKLYWTDSVAAFLRDTLYEGIPQGLTAASYSGERINVANDTDNQYNWDVLATNGIKGQSGASYGDYLFIVADKLAAIYMYNLKKKRMIYSLPLTAHTETVSAGSTTVLYHCNQSTFGTVKYAADDPFPLLYVSQRGPSSTGRCFINGLRIIPVKASGSTEYTSFSVQEVQTIYLPKMTEANALGNANFTIDPQTGYGYCHSRNNNRNANYLNCRISKFAPIDPHQPVVYLENKDVLESYEIYTLNGLSHISAENMQGGFIWNNKYYIAQGYPSCGYIYMRVVDLEKKKLVNDIDLMGNGFPVEPEGVFIYDGRVTFSCIDGSIYSFNFK